MSFLRERIRAGRTIWAVGIHDALSAKVAEYSGFEAIMTGGFGISASLLGLPDFEFLSLAENLAVVTRISQAVRIPVIADIDTGYGNALNVWHAVRSFGAAGAQAVILEDQVSPKRCAACVDETTLIPISEAVSKIRAAREAAGERVVVIARTDAFEPSEALARSKAYAEAGADLIQPVSKTFRHFEELVELRNACGLPLSIQILGWLETLKPEAIGQIAGLATFSLVSIMTATRALMENLRRLHETLDCSALPCDRMALEEFKEFIGFNRLLREEEKFRLIHTDGVGSSELRSEAVKQHLSPYQGKRT
jgi:2-methylisocitrate lyase-like PEP mutase family enzyme